MQAASLYSMDFPGKVFGAPPVARKYQSMRCHKDEGTIFYLEFASQADTDGALGFIRGFVWGEDHPTYMHPELIDRWKNIIVVTSFRNPKPIAERVMGRLPGASSGPTDAKAMASSVKKDFEKAKAAYLKKNYPTAERYFRAITTVLPEFANAHLYLGHSLFYQEKFRESIPEYELTKALYDGQQEKVELRDERILNDQLGMAYGLSGRLEEARNHFEGAIKKDPAYPFYYYNLACAFAELNDLDGALANLKLVSEHRANFLPGESYPNPREDDSFKKYVGNPKFEAAMKEIGF
jgi:tetratricopeptide (TPR) repeat protein